MENIITILWIVSILSLIGLIGMAVTWIIGKVVHKETTIKVGKVGMLCMLVLAVITFAGAQGVQKIWDNKLANNRTEFRKYARKFQKDYNTTSNMIEVTHSDIADKWYDALDGDFDTAVDEEIALQDDSDIKQNFKNMRNDITRMKVFDTADMDMDYKDFQSAYNKLHQYYELTFEPGGESYDSYQSKESKYDTSIKDYYSKMQAFNE
ncbi:hypothetical protein V3C97_05520 [Ligilactobacillus saerimneri]|uniref:hypothetical protein n=1 Tax=Ligilactobacillus saerimneri TaxID=228229 RepID=UPI0030D17390